MEASGAAVVLGQASPAGVDLSTGADHTLTGVDLYEQAGSSADGAGDFDHDGLDDLIVGARAHGAMGRAYLAFGE